MRYALSTGLAAAMLSASPALADVRIIKEDFSSNGNSTQFQNHNTNTPFVSPGATVNLTRSSLSYIWIYEHGIDLLPTSITDDGAGVSGKEYIGIKGSLSRVMLPVGATIIAASGAKAYEISVTRAASVGSTVRFTVNKPTGTISFSGRIVCPASGGNETLSKLLAARSSVDALGAGAQASLTIELDMAPPCQKQSLQITLPRCIQSALPGSSSRFGSNSLLLEAADPKTITLPLFGVATGQCPSGGGGDISLTTNGVTLKVPVRYFDNSTVRKVQPLVPQPGNVMPAPPPRPGGTVTPTPRPLQP